MSLYDFFEPIENEDTNTEEIKLIDDKKSDLNKKKNNTNFKPIKQYKSVQFSLNQDIEDIFLLDVIYEPQQNVAQCIFYHDETHSLYRWNDNTGHKPYLLTDISKDTLDKYDKLVNSQDFNGIDEIEKIDLLAGVQKKYSRVYGKTPLSIGGSSSALRNIIEPSYEADIRYHLNYISDRGITPGTYYYVKNGKLLPKHQKIKSDITEELELEFKNEHPARVEMLDSYMPLLFQSIPNLFRCAFDIEVGSEKSKMPNVINPEHPIISIALADINARKICWVLNKNNFEPKKSYEMIEIRRFDVEIELIDNFLDEVNNYPVVLSFNGDKFDCPYLVNRAIKLGMSKKDIPIVLRRNDASFKNSIHLDIHQFYRQASIRLYAFSGKYDSASLDSLSKSLLSKRKLDHPDVWINEMDFDTLVKYNVLDAELTLELTQFDDNITINLMIILMRISKMPIYDFSRSAVSRWLHMWLVFEHRKRGYIIPRKNDIIEIKGGGSSDAIIDGKKFQGAIVLEPFPGVWWNVHVLDFASLYPSIIKTKNLSYETIRCAHNECKSNIVPGLDHWICNKREGMFSILLGFIRDTRVKWFKPRASKNNPDLKNRRINHVIQASLKVLINAGYGVVGSEAFDFFCLPVAESTTAFARDAIIGIRNYIENKQNIKVIYGDTDSVFILDPSKKQIDSILKWSIDNIGIELGTDYEFRYVVFSERKKNYFGITYDGDTIVKGLMGKKSNTPLIIRNTFSKMLDYLKPVKNQSDMEIAKGKIHNLLSDLVYRINTGQFTVEEVLVRITLSRKISDYTTWIPTVQCVAQLINAKIKKINQFSIGDRIEFIKLSKPKRVMVPEGFSFPINEVRSASVVPVELIKKGSKLNGKPILDIAESTFSQILQSLNISWARIIGKTSLDDFF